MSVSLFPPQRPLPGELRRCARVSFRRRAWCEHRDWTFYLTVANVSLEGMFLQTSTHFAPGERLWVCISEGEPRIVVQVEVVWSSERGRLIGIGCRVASFAEGAQAYARLVEQLDQSGR